MTGFSAPLARVFAAGLALAAGYAAAAYAGTSRVQPASQRGSAMFGAINSVWDDGVGSRPASGRTRR